MFYCSLSFFNIFYTHVHLPIFFRSSFFFILFYFLMRLRPPTSTLFPYTTLFRSCLEPGSEHEGADAQAHERSRTGRPREDRKSTRLNSSHVAISYAVFCLKKKKSKHKCNSSDKSVDNTNKSA